MKNEIATFGGGCFWCTEAIFKRLKGVISVESGYTGGSLEQNVKPSYEEVSSGTTGHAEAIQITFDPAVISYATLLDIFWHTHNPTTRNQQGADIGSQYRSVIFYHTEKQQKQAEESKVNLEKEGYYKEQIVTEVLPFTKFYPAESYHKDYYDRNRDAGYCTIVIDPKIKKLLSLYGAKVKEEYKE